MQLVDPSGPPSSRRRPPEWHRSSLVDMKTALDSGLITSRALVEAHLDRIREVNREILAFTEVRSEEALAAADRLDEERQAGKVRGPLHGLPVSIKECFDFAGRPTTLGIPSRREQRADRDAAMVRALREAGAILIGRTNLCQLALTYECDNPVFGRTSNPFSPRHSAGGSSGGDAAAVAAGLVPLGIGTDLGGSVRVPAHFSGVAALLPTRNRLPNSGVATPVPGLTATMQTGLIARSAADIELALDALGPLMLSSFDPDVPPATDIPAPPLKSLTVGVFTESDLPSPSGAIVGAVERARDALRAQGVRVVPFVPPGLSELFFAYGSVLSADGGKAALAAVGDEPVAESLRPLFMLLKTPSAVRSGLAKVARLAGDREISRLLELLDAKSSAELFELRARISTLVSEIVTAMDSAGVHALLAAPFATPALPHGRSGEIILAGAHAAVWNAAGFPAGVTPVTRVHGAEARRDQAKGRLGRMLRRIDEESAGLPVGVQIIARPWHDHTVLALMSAIEKNVKSDVDFPRTPVW